MSPNVSSFVSDLVHMAQATERLPQLERELESERAANANLRDVVQRLELHAIDRKAEIDALHARIRDLEVSRDDAELRFLEVEDSKLAALRAFRVIIGEAEACVKVMDPPKAQEPDPVKAELEATEGIQPHVVGEEQGKPIVGFPGNPVPGTMPHDFEWDTPKEAASQGQSEADPTATSVTEHGSQDAKPIQDGDAQQTTPSPDPYFGKRYYDHPVWVSLDDWLTGGGTEEDYHWRPNARSAL